MLFGTTQTAKTTRPYDDLRTLRAAVMTRISPKRALHTDCVCQEIDTLALRWRVDRTKAAQAALLHDVTKEFAPEAQLKLCKEYDIVAQYHAVQGGGLVHAVTGAAAARFEYGMDEDVCEAIRWHTTGKAGMNSLEMILYLADFVDATRRFPGVHALRRLSYEDLRAAMLMGLDLTIQFLLHERKSLHISTVEARNAFVSAH